nr:MAG TPA: hypothetical protein [Bacteriophage sp.]
MRSYLSCKRIPCIPINIVASYCYIVSFFSRRWYIIYTYFSFFYDRSCTIIVIYLRFTFTYPRTLFSKLFTFWCPYLSIYITILRQSITWIKSSIGI